MVHIKSFLIHSECFSATPNLKETKLYKNIGCTPWGFVSLKKISTKHKMLPMNMLPSSTVARQTTIKLPNTQK